MRKHSTTHAPFDSGYPADVLGSSVPDIGGTSAALIEANACRVADRWIAFHGEHFWRWHSLLSHKHFTHQDGPGSGRFKRATCPWSELVAGAARDMVVASARTTAAEIAARSGVRQEIISGECRNPKTNGAVAGGGPREDVSSTGLLIRYRYTGVRRNTAVSQLRMEWNTRLHAAFTPPQPAPLL